MMVRYEFKRKAKIIFILPNFNYFAETVLDRPIWWHYLCITIPIKITKPDVGYLLIDGGSNTVGYTIKLSKFKASKSMILS